MREIEKQLYLYDKDKHTKFEMINGKEAYGTFYCREVINEKGNSALIIIKDDGGVVINMGDIFSPFVQVGIQMQAGLGFGCKAISYVDEELNLETFFEDPPVKMLFNSPPAAIQGYFDLVTNDNLKVFETYIEEYFGVKAEDKAGTKYERNGLVLVKNKKSKASRGEKSK